jgi:hypothetical protein
VQVDPDGRDRLSGVECGASAAHGGTSPGRVGDIQRRLVQSHRGDRRRVGQRNLERDDRPGRVPDDQQRALRRTSHGQPIGDLDLDGCRAPRRRTKPVRRPGVAHHPEVRGQPVGDGGPGGQIAGAAVHDQDDRSGALLDDRHRPVQPFDLVRPLACHEPEPMGGRNADERVRPVV